MDDRQEQTIEKYGFQVKNRYRVRGAVLLDTDEGLRMLRQCDRLGEHFSFENRIKENLAEKGFGMTDRVVPNLDGDAITEWENGIKYVVYCWYSGNECDYRSGHDLCLAAENLGRLHLALREKADTPVPPEEDLMGRYQRRIRELKRVRSERAILNFTRLPVTRNLQKRLLMRKRNWHSPLIFRKMEQAREIYAMVSITITTSL